MNHALTALFDPSQLSTIITVQKVVGVLVACWATVSLAAALAGASRWTVIHPLTLGVVTTAIQAYSTHFADALTRTASRPAGLAVRIAAVNLALVAMLLGAPLAIPAAVAAAALCWHGVSIARKLRRGLTSPFASTARCYVVAAAFFALAAAVAVGSRHVGPSLIDATIAAHSRLAVWGFAWTTIAGTVITLLPTMTGNRASATARARLPRALLAHCIALPAAAAAALASPPLAAVALAVCALAWSYALQPVLAGALFTPGLSAPAVSVAAGLLWLLGAMFADAATLATGAVRFPANLLTFLLAAGLAQVVAGAIGHLLPVLARGTREPDNGFIKVGVVNGGALVALVSPRIGLAILGVGLALHARKVAVP